MKKFTLTLAACAVVFSGMAQRVAVSKVADISKPSMEKMEVRSNYKMFSELKASGVQHESLKANIAKLPITGNVLRQPSAKAEVQAMPAYMIGSIMEANVLGGTVPVSMVPSLIATTTEQNSEILLVDVWGLEYAIAGVIIKGQNSLSQIGADSVAFINNQVIFTAANNGIGEDIVVTSIDFSRDENRNPVMTRSSSETFGGYYFPENNEVYIPELVGCYTATGNEPLAYSDTPIYSDLDILGGMDDYITKTIITGTSDNEPVNTEGKAVVLGNNIYVQGALFDMPETWLCISGGEEGFVSESFQWIGLFSSGPGVTGTAVHDSQPGYYSCGLEDMPFAIGNDLDDNLIVTPANEKFLAGLVLAKGTSGLSLAGICSISENLEIIVTNELASSISDLTSDVSKVSSKAYFDLSGRKVTKNAKGLVIEKVTYANGKTESRKVIM